MDVIGSCGCRMHFCGCGRPNGCHTQQALVNVIGAHCSASAGVKICLANLAKHQNFL